MAKANKTDILLKKVGSKIKELRIEAGYNSYETFAIEFDLSRRYYWGVEKGRNLTLEFQEKSGQKYLASSSIF